MFSDSGDDWDVDAPVAGEPVIPSTPPTLPTYTAPPALPTQVPTPPPVTGNSNVEDESDEENEGWGDDVPVAGETNPVQEVVSSYDPDIEDDYTVQDFEGEENQDFGDWDVEGEIVGKGSSSTGAIEFGANPNVRIVAGHVEVVAPGSSRVPVPPVSAPSNVASEVSVDDEGDEGWGDDVPVAGVPSLPVPSVSTPIVDTPVVETPVWEVPVVSVPAPVVDVPVSPPVSNTPTVSTPVREDVDDEGWGDDVPVAGVPVSPVPSPMPTSMPTPVVEVPVSVSSPVPPVSAIPSPPVVTSSPIATPVVETPVREVPVHVPAGSPVSVPVGERVVSAEDYTYRVEYSEEDAAWVGTVFEFPSLAWAADTEEDAREGIVYLVREELVGNTVVSSEQGEASGFVPGFGGANAGSTVLLPGITVIEDDGKNAVREVPVLQPGEEGRPGMNVVVNTASVDGEGKPVNTKSSKGGGPAKSKNTPAKKSRKKSNTIGGIRLTARDMQIMAFLARYRMATVGQLARRFETSETALRNRLPLLDRAGLITWAWAAQTKPKIWLITDQGLKTVGMTLTAPTVSWGQLRHNLGLVDLGITFELGEEIVLTEREIRAAATRYTPTDRLRSAMDLSRYQAGLDTVPVDGLDADAFMERVRQSLIVPVPGRSMGHIPDMVLARQPFASGASGNIAIELELTRKSISEWKTVLTAYVNSPYFSEVYYFVIGRDLLRGLQGVVKGLGAESKIKIIQFEPIDLTADPNVSGASL